MADGAYGLWALVILNTALFVVFAVSFFHPKTKRDWRAMGAYTAFLVALFTEMYGIRLRSTYCPAGSGHGSRSSAPTMPAGIYGTTSLVGTQIHT